MGGWPRFVGDLFEIYRLHLQWKRLLFLFLFFLYFLVILHKTPTRPIFIQQIILHTQF